MQLGGDSAPKQVAGASEGMVSLSEYIDLNKASVLNNDSKTYVKSILEGQSNGLVKSDEDVDAQLLFFIPFREQVKIRGIRLISLNPETDDVSAPKTLKLFVNKPNISFDDADSVDATEVITLTEKQVTNGEEIRIKFVKFQNVTSLTIFVAENQKDSPVTFLSRLEFIGTPIAGTDMSQLKKSG